jgi:UDP-4-amino-4,6-dideoxy-N-acetyl-beta-L-altrosamine N-acetyltransferase
LAEGDGPLVVRWRNRPEIHSQLFAQHPPTLEGHRRWFAEYSQSNDRREYVIEEGGQPAGTIGLAHIDWDNGRAEYGILIGEPNARGRGLAASASRQLLREAFGSLGLSRIYLHVLPDNAAAIRLYERLGFRREGLLREHAIKDGRRRDVVVMGLLARDLGDGTGAP